MAKGGRGGKRSAITTAPATSVKGFIDMTPDEQANTIISAMNADIPDFLSDSSMQRMSYQLGMDGKPTLVDDATLDSMSGTEIFRTVNQVYDRKNDVNYNADEIIDQIQNGDVTRFSDTGGSAYGRGIYFADSYSESSFYGNTRNNIKQTAMTRAKLNDKAKVITYNQASTGAQAEINSGSSLGKALAKCDRQSQSSIWALSKGYNVISSNNSRGYFNVLDRSALTMSKTVKPMSNKW